MKPFVSLSCAIAIVLLGQSSSSLSQTPAATVKAPTHFRHSCGTGCTVEATMTNTVKQIRLTDGKIANTATFLLKITGGRGTLNTTADIQYYAICASHELSYGDKGKPPKPGTWRQIQGNDSDYTTTTGSGGYYFDALCKSS